MTTKLKSAVETVETTTQQSTESKPSLLQQAKTQFNELKTAHDILFAEEMGLYARKTFYDAEMVSWNVRRTALVALTQANHSHTSSQQALHDQWKNLANQNTEFDKLDVLKEFLAKSIPEAERNLHRLAPLVAHSLGQLQASYVAALRVKEFDRLEKLLKTTTSFQHKTPDGANVTITQNELLAHLIDSTECIQKASQIRIPSPPHSVTRDLPTNTTDIIGGTWPPQPLRQTIINALISYVNLLLKGATLLFEAIEKAINVGTLDGIGGRLKESDLLPITPAIPIITDQTDVRWLEPLRGTPQALFNRNVNEYRENVLVASGKSEHDLSDNERQMLDRLCQNFEEQTQHVREVQSLGQLGN